MAKHDDANAERYDVSYLVSDLPGVALLQDSDLVNAWGISFSATSPFWVSDNGTGRSTLYSVTYNDQGEVEVAKVPLWVAIPGEGNPTGTVFNDTGAFNGDIFLFVSEDGTISGWRPALGATPGTSAEILGTREGAIYKGVTLASAAGQPLLLAANFSEGTVDAYDASMSLTQFTDPQAPAGYAPFNVQRIGGMIVVTFAKQDEEGEGDVSGPGNGLIDLFNPDTGAFTRLATGSDAGGHLRDINSPWGVALAPDSFGRHAGDLLVGNFGSGTIMAFDPSTAKYRGLLKDAEGGRIEIEGLWALAFGNGGRAGRPETLYFTAGPDDESHGLFGSIDPSGKGKEDRNEGDDD